MRSSIQDGDIRRLPLASPRTGADQAAHGVGSPGVVFSKLITVEVVPLLTRLGSESGAKRLLILLEILAVLSRDTQSCRLCATSSHVQHSAEDKRRIDRIYRYLSEQFS